MSTNKQYYGSIVSIAAIALLVAIGLSGCGKRNKLPTLHPVHGRVQFSNGKAVTCGLVSFQSQKDNMVSATGVIAPDGTFTVTSFTDGDRKAGAMLGPHRVSISPPMTHEGEPFRYTELREFLTVKPGDNEFTLTVEDR